MNTEPRIEDEPPSHSATRLLAPFAEGRPELPAGREPALWARLESQLPFGSPTPARFALLRPAPLLLGGFALAAAGLAIWFQPSGGETRPSPTPSAMSTPEPTAPEFLTAASDLPSGAHVDLHEGRVAVRTATATATHLFVERGGVTSQVPKLGAGERYEVETPQALVSVHGTRFTVTRSGEAVTLIDVESGLVSVDPPGWRPAFFLRPGERAEVGPCPQTPAAASASSFDARCVADGLRAVAATAHEGLVRENALLRAGRLLQGLAPRDASEVWRALLAAAPRGVHAEEAAFALGASLRDAGELAAADAADAAFRAQFPESRRAGATKQF